LDEIRTYFKENPDADFWLPAPPKAGLAELNPSTRGQKLFSPRPLFNFCPLVEISAIRSINTKHAFVLFLLS
jgi:hypothetical protein